MSRRTSSIVIIAMRLMCCIGAINSAATGYYYAQPIKQFNPPPFPTLRSTGPFDGITFGQKVVSSPRPRITIPPLPTSFPLTSLTPTQATRLQPAPFLRAQPSPTPYSRLVQPQQFQLKQGPLQQQQQQQQIPQSQFQKVQQTPRLQVPQQPFQFQFQRQPSPPPQTSFTRVPQYTYIPPQSQPQFPNTVQPRISPQSVVRVTPPTLKPIQKLSPTPTPRPVVPQRSPVPTFNPPKANIPARPLPKAVPTAVNRPIEKISNLTQAGPGADEVYVIDGRQLKQYKVYEQIDNDIDHEVENFIPANFFLSNYHARISPTHPLGEDVQLQSRAGFFQNGQQRQQPAAPNTVALGSGGLGFVKLPNGNVYLGSGSLGYISNTQRNQEVANLRSRTGAELPDALHFGHGPLSDSFYYQK